MTHNLYIPTTVNKRGTLHCPVCGDECYGRLCKHMREQHKLNIKADFEYRCFCGHTQYTLYDLYQHIADGGLEHALEFLLP